MAERVTVKCECSSCGGTGLCVDWTCHDGAAQVCRECGGTGAGEISFIPFKGRKKREGIVRVFPTTPWTHLYPVTHTFEDRTVYFEEYGCSFEEWERGVEPKPVKF